MTTPRLISCDDHLDLSALPPDLWSERLPAHHRAAAPRVVDTDAGRFWFVGNRRLWRSGGDPRLPTAIQRAGLEDDGYRATDPVRRLADMDRDGLQASVMYGPVIGLSTEAIGDRDLTHACYRAYNEWAADFNRTDPTRLCALALVPADDPAAAAAEAERAAGLGHRGVQLAHFETSTPIFDPAWEPLWTVCESARLPVSFHLASGTYLLKVEPGSWQIAGYAAVAPMQLDEVLAVLLLSGILERHPDLHTVLAESGLGWVPYILERCETQLDRYGPRMQDFRPTMRPRELFRRQVFVTFEEDDLGVQLLDQIGAGNVMWASDYPHPDSTFPNSRTEAERRMGPLDARAKAKVLGENCAALYGVGRGGEVES